MKRKIFLVSFLMLCCAAGMAQVFTYEPIDSESVKVTGYDGELPSETTIPEVCEYDGKTVTVTSIGDEAFANCSTIVKLNLPSTLTSIGQGAFEKCAYLNQVELPASLVSLPNNPFRFCPRLNSVTIDPNNTAFKVIDDVVYNADVTKLLLYPGGKGESTFVVPDGVITIGSYAFAGNANFYDLTFPNSTETLQQAALLGCTYLQHVHFGAGIKYILAPQFIEEWGGEPYGITTVDFANIETGPYIKEVFDLETMPDLSIYIPLGRRDLYKTSELEISSTTGPEPTGWADIIDYVHEAGYADEDSNETPLYYCSIPETENEVVLSQDAQYSVRYEGHLTIPESIIANGKTFVVTQIGTNAFYQSSDLLTVSLPSTITEIGDNVFFGNLNLESVTVDEGNTHFVSEDGVLYDAAKETLIVLPSAHTVTSFTTPETVRTLSICAVSNMKNLTYFSTNAEYVNNGNFYNSKKLKEIHMTNANLQEFYGQQSCDHALYFINATTPPQSNEYDSFYGCYLIVDGSVRSAYETAESGIWTKFEAILSPTGHSSFDDNVVGLTDAYYIENLEVVLNFSRTTPRTSCLPFSIPISTLEGLGIVAYEFVGDVLNQTDNSISLTFREIQSGSTPINEPMILRSVTGNAISFAIQNVLKVEDFEDAENGYEVVSNYQETYMSAFYATTASTSSSGINTNANSCYSISDGVLGKVGTSVSDIPPYRWYYTYGVSAPTGSPQLRLKLTGLGADSETVLESVSENLQRNSDIFFNLAGQRSYAKSGLLIRDGKVEFVR